MVRILVIEDDVSLRSLLSIGLEMQGYRVVEAANGAEGLACYGTAPADVVITDMRMPVMDGLQMMKVLHRACPTAKIIAISGEQHDLTQARLYAQRTFAKPFSLSALLAAVAELVCAAAPPACVPGAVAAPTGVPVAVAAYHMEFQ